MPPENEELSYPTDLGFAGDTHEWARLNGEFGTIGISDYAQHEIGDVVFVEPPEVGEEVSAEGDFGVIESVKSAFDIFAPMSGEVVEVNIELETHPELINEDPYGKGWIARLRVSDPSEFAALMQADEYRAAVEGD